MKTYLRKAKYLTSKGHTLEINVWKHPEITTNIVFELGISYKTFKNELEACRYFDSCESRYDRRVKLEGWIKQ